MLSCTPNDPHWQPRVFIPGQGQIAPRQRLMGSLPPCLRVSAAVAGVENLRAQIRCVLIAPSQHYRGGAHAATARDAGNEWPMQPRPGQLDA